MSTSSQASSSATITHVSDNRYQLSGVLNFASVPALWSKAQDLLAKADDVQIDFSQVEQCNSAGLALLIEMARLMKNRGGVIRFHELPDQLLTVARAYGVESELISQDYL